MEVKDFFAWGAAAPGEFPGWCAGGHRLGLLPRGGWCGCAVRGAGVTMVGGLPVTPIDCGM